MAACTSLSNLHVSVGETMLKVAARAGDLGGVGGGGVGWGAGGHLGGFVFVFLISFHLKHFSFCRVRVMSCAELGRAMGIIFWYLCWSLIKGEEHRRPRPSHTPVSGSSKCSWICPRKRRSDLDSNTRWTAGFNITPIRTSTATHNKTRASFNVSEPKSKHLWATAVVGKQTWEVDYIAFWHKKTK